MLNQRLVLAVFCLFAVICIGSPSTMGQASATGTVSGTVTDTSGAAVPGATVSLIDAATASARNVTTSDTGAYVIPYVNPGTFNIKVSKQGFKTTVVTNQVVEIGRQLSVNAVLEIGSVSQTVEVTVTVGADHAG